ncbi:type II secretion system protein GspD [Massilia agri]
MLVVFSGRVFAAPLPPASFDFDSIPLADLVRVVYVQAFPAVAYTVDPAALQDRRPVSFRWRTGDGDFRTVFAAFLRGLGYELVTRGRLDVVRPLPAEVEASAVEDASREVIVYRPRFRDGAQLIEMVAPLFSGRFTSQRSMNIAAPSSPSVGPSGSAPAPAPVAAPSGSLLDLSNRRSDEIIFAGSPREVAALRKLFSQLDVDPGQVVVTGALYEVNTGTQQSSALQLAASVLRGRFRFSLGAAQEAGNYLSLGGSSVTTIMQALDTDSRFKVLSSPSLRVASGQTASLTVGNDVPVLGAITYPSGGGAPVQSVDYRSSGVLFTIAPIVRDASISVKVDQQVSSFVATTTGVNNSPTLTKRELSTSVSLADGDVVVIGGLREDKDSSTASRPPFWKSLFGSKARETAHSEILLFLQLRKI